MINLDGKKVKILLKIGGSVEGFVKIWNEEYVLLTNFDSKNQLIINDPQQNILMIHVILEEISKKVLEPVEPKVLEQTLVDPDPKELQLDHYEPDSTLRFKKLAELRQAQLKEHKLNLSKHLTNWKNGQANKNYGEIDYYGNPSFINTISNGATQESNGSSPSNSSGLSRMHKKSSKT